LRVTTQAGGLLGAKFHIDFVEAADEELGVFLLWSARTILNNRLNGETIGQNLKSPFGNLTINWSNLNSTET
jgi:hypothetical protein